MPTPQRERREPGDVCARCSSPMQQGEAVILRHGDLYHLRCHEAASATPRVDRKPDNRRGDNPAKPSA